MTFKIARKEFTEMIRDGRFRWAFVVVLVLLMTSLALGYKHYRKASSERQAAQAETRRQWMNQGERNPHTAAHYGVYAFRPKGPLSFVDPGLDSYTGAAVWIEAHNQNPARYRPAEDATALQRFGELTAATTLELLLPLLIILLTFSAFAGEREAGTLRQLLSLGAQRKRLVMGKAFGVAAALGAILAPATAVGVVALALVSDVGLLAQGIPRMILMWASYLLYFGAFIGLSLAVSAFAANARAALVLLLAFWIANGLLVPRLASDTAERLYRTPTAGEFWAAVEHDKKQGIDGHNTADKRGEELKKQVLARYGVGRVEDLPVNFSGIALQAGEEYTNQVWDKNYGKLWDTYQAQQNAHRMASLIAPLIAMRSLSMSLAGADLAEHWRFTTEAEQYRRVINKMLNEDLIYNSKIQGFNYFADAKLWGEIPDFHYAAPDIWSAIRQQSWAAGALVLWFCAAWAFAIFAASGMKV
jgi:ABC-2 type transport system permease protein